MRRIADTTDPHEIDALVMLIDRLPHLADAMNDAIPLLGRIDQVGPELNQLLESVSDLNRMVGWLPKAFRRRRDGAADET